MASTLLYSGRFRMEENNVILVLAEDQAVWQKALRKERTVQYRADEGFGVLIHLRLRALRAEHLVVLVDLAPALLRVVERHVSLQPNIHTPWHSQFPTVRPKLCLIMKSNFAESMQTQRASAIVAGRFQSRRTFV